MSTQLTDATSSSSGLKAVMVSISAFLAASTNFLGNSSPILSPVCWEPRVSQFASHRGYCSCIVCKKSSLNSCNKLSMLSRSSFSESRRTFDCVFMDSLCLNWSSFGPFDASIFSNSVRRSMCSASCSSGRPCPSQEIHLMMNWLALFRSCLVSSRHRGPCNRIGHIALWCAFCIFQFLWVGGSAVVPLVQSLQPSKLLSGLCAHVRVLVFAGVALFFSAWSHTLGN